MAERAVNLSPLPLKTKRKRKLWEPGKTFDSCNSLNNFIDCFDYSERQRRETKPSWIIQSGESPLESWTNQSSVCEREQKLSKSKLSLCIRWRIVGLLPTQEISFQIHFDGWVSNKLSTRFERISIIHPRSETLMRFASISAEKQFSNFTLNEMSLPIIENMNLQSAFIAGLSQISFRSEATIINRTDPLIKIL